MESDSEGDYLTPTEDVEKKGVEVTAHEVDGAESSG